MVLISGRYSPKGAENAQISVTEKIIGFLGSYLEYDDEDVKLIRYGLHGIIRTFGGIFVALTAAWAMNILPYALVYLGIFLTIRIYAGGYHASTARGCAAITSTMIALAYVYIRYCSMSALIVATTYSISAITILLVSPVENIKKPISEHETTVYKKRTYLLIVIVTIGFVIAIVYDKAQIYRSIVASVSEIMTLLIFGIFDNRRNLAKKCV